MGLSGISGVMPREGIIGTYAPSLLTGKREKSYHKREEGKVRTQTDSGPKINSKKSTKKRIIGWLVSWVRKESAG